MFYFKLKKVLLYPYVCIQRRIQRNREHQERMVLEVFNYSPQIFRFLKKVELLYNHALDRDSLVIDVGGFTGEWAREMQRRYNPKMHVFEPNPNMLVHLNEAFLKSETVQVHTYGLSDRDSATVLLLKGPGSSVYKHPGIKEGNHATASIQLRNIETVFDELAIKRVQLFKINIEGGEYPLLYRMLDLNLTARCEQILVQFHEWYPWARWHRWNIGRKLRKTHKRVWCYPFIWEKWVLKEALPYACAVGLQNSPGANPPGGGAIAGMQMHKDVPQTNQGV